MKIIKLSISLTLLTLISLTAHGQSDAKAERKLFRKARKQLSNEKYIDAQSTYKELLKLNGKDDVYNFETGLSYYFSDHEREKSLPYFETTLANSKEDTIPELYYYLGKAYQLNYKFEESKTALVKFKRFINSSKKAGQYLLKETVNSIRENETAMVLLDTKDNDAKVINLGSVINTGDREYAPVYRTEEGVLLFTSRRKKSKGRLAKDLLPYEDIYVAVRTGDGKWKMIEESEELKKHLPTSFNTKKHDAGIIYSADGTTLYTYKKDKLWFSQYTDGKWGELKELASNVNESKLNVPSISISKDGKTIFFVATRKDGYGGKDIYMAKKSGDNTWSKPELMDERINTPEDEDAPYLSMDGKTLYFSSTGHKGVGGYDIFKVNIENDSVSNPVNMGFPLNSPQDDIYYIVDEANEKGFLSSNRGGGNGAMDIFEVILVASEEKQHKIDGLITNEDNKNIEGAEITLASTDPESEAPEHKVKAENGQFQFVVDSKGEHKLTVESPEHQKQSINITLPEEGIESKLGVVMTKFEDDKHNYQVMWLVSEELGIDQKDTIITDKLIAENPGDTTKIPATTGTEKEWKFNFGYNKTEISSSDKGFQDIIASITDKAKAGQVLVSIESSASKVPTKTYGTNEKLAESRANDAKTILLASLKGKVDENKIVFKSINSIVSGPPYRGDYKNETKYEEYQYVRIIVH